MKVNYQVPDQPDWRQVARLLLQSRLLDEIEETRLLPERKILYQFSARGHDLAQILLGSLINHPSDAASGYYRSRPLLLTLGLDLEDAAAGPMGKSGGISAGRDIGVVFNLTVEGRPKVLPMAGGVGSQYTPTAGWAQSLLYRAEILGEAEHRGALALVLGGDGSVATNGFWSALTMATARDLPLLFYIEDNGYGLSVPSIRQTPGGNIAANLASFKNLAIFDGDGTEPEDAYSLLKAAVSHVRSWKGPALIRLTVPRLCGHSGQDTQAYKTEQEIEAENLRDPLPKLKSLLVSNGTLTESDWNALDEQTRSEVETAVAAATARSEPDAKRVQRYVFEEHNDDGTADAAGVGGRSFKKYGKKLEKSERPESARINMAAAIGRTLASELEANPALLVFGEDVGPKGGVHGITQGLQEHFGATRVFNTSLSEEGIIGRAIGMAYAGLMPVTEIQFRKYADPATEQLNDCGTVRWRTNNRFSTPIVVRVAGGFSKCGDPWHSVSDESNWAHAIGWQVLYPSNAVDAAGLLRFACRSENPSYFFEHRYLLDAPCARANYPGDDYIVEPGVAKTLQSGTELTIVSWGAMLERSLQAARDSGFSVEVIDLRTLMPWDKECVLNSVENTGRCLIVHEDTLTAGFGSEIAACVASEAFLSLKAPVERMATPDIPLAYNTGLMEASLPSTPQIVDKICELVEFD